MADIINWLTFLEIKTIGRLTSGNATRAKEKDIDDIEQASDDLKNGIIKKLLHNSFCAKFSYDCEKLTEPRSKRGHSSETRHKFDKGLMWLRYYRQLDYSIKLIHHYNRKHNIDEPEHPECDRPQSSNNRTTV